MEWALEASTSTIAALPCVGSEARVLTHLHVTQDSLRLYGFATAEERRLFLSLLTVSGVGPSLAKKILSGMSPSRLSQALDSEDMPALCSISGLGKKTAQKIVLQLRGKLTTEEDEMAVGEASEVSSSLAAMGFDAKAAAKAVSVLLEDPSITALSGEEREKEILRRAIVELSS